MNPKQKHLQTSIMPRNTLDLAINTKMLVIFHTYKLNYTSVSDILARNWCLWPVSLTNAPTSVTYRDSKTLELNYSSSLVFCGAWLFDFFLINFSLICLSTSAVQWMGNTYNDHINYMVTKQSWIFKSQLLFPCLVL